MAKIGSVCVYCGSSNQVDVAHLTAARDFGRTLAEEGVRLVFGGGRVGLMGAMADGALDAGGRTTGVIPTFLQDLEVGHDGLESMEVVDAMHPRKARMVELADAFCVLPGGLGTLDEAFEVITWRQLGLHDKPIVLVNLGGFWQPLLDLIAHQASNGYIRQPMEKLVIVVDRIADILPALESAPDSELESATDKL
ncbi:MAG: TIGR00730 family Rossman fold protein [Pseudomonadota bacterium]